MVRMEFVVKFVVYFVYQANGPRLTDAIGLAEVAKKKAVGYFEILGCISVTCTGKG